MEIYLWFNWLTSLALRKKCLFSELFWSVFSRFWTECGEILRISPYSVRMRENTDQNNSEYVHFSRNVDHVFHTDIFCPFSKIVCTVCYIYWSSHSIILIQYQFRYFILRFCCDQKINSGKSFVMPVCIETLLWLTWTCYFNNIL